MKFDHTLNEKVRKRLPLSNVTNHFKLSELKPTLFPDSKIASHIKCKYVLLGHIHIHVFQKLFFDVCF